MNEENKKLFDKEIVELEQLKGEERGVDIKYLVECVIRKEGEDGLKELKIELAEKYDFFLPDLNKIKDVEWISEVIPHIFLIASIRFFGWSEEDIYQMGKGAVSYSRTIKMFVKYFASIKQTIQRAANSWNEYYTEGTMSMTSFDKEKKEAILELRDFKTHPLVCVYISGVIAKILELVTAEKGSRVEEVRCVFKGDDHHAFRLIW